MSNSITLTHADVNSGTAVKIKGARIGIALKNNVNSTPNSDGDLTSVPDVPVMSSELPRYQITFKIDTESTETNILTQELLYDFMQVDISSSSQLILNVTYGTSDITLKSWQKIGGNRTANIPVVIEPASLSLDQTQSDKAYMITGQFTLVESK